MQNIIIDKPYEFVAPRFSRLWPALLDRYMPRYLEKSYGLVKIECRGVERLKASLSAGHGVLIASNHSRPCDPMVIGSLSRAAGCHFFIMASWHLFMQDRASRFLLNRAGAFSVYREGNDKSALGAAMDILVDAKRPLLIFPEGVISRTNDCLSPLMEGTAFIARGAAKKRTKNNAAAKIVIHPISINYFFRGDIHTAAGPVLGDIEKRLGWRQNPELPLLERLYKVGNALLTLKEIEITGQPQAGSFKERIPKLIDRLLDPLEKEWRSGKREAHTIARVKKLRQAILPDMATGSLARDERERRWRHLADAYLAQQLDFYRPDYVRSKPTPERILETIERFEEDMTDSARIHRPMAAVVEAGEAIEVSPERDRGAAADPVMQALETSLKAQLARNARD